MTDCHQFQVCGQDSFGDGYRYGCEELSQVPGLWTGQFR